jgi:hypothetical protein
MSVSEIRPSGAEAQIIRALYAARLKPCPTRSWHGPRLLEGCARKRTDGKFLNAEAVSEDGSLEISRNLKIPTQAKRGLEWGTLIGARVKLLLADAELGDHTFIALGIVFLEVVEQATALADQHEKSTARAVVFLVRFEVLRQLANALAEQRDLDLRAPGVGRVRAIAVNHGLLLLSG